METIPIVIAFKTLVLRREPNYICKNKGNPETLERKKKSKSKEKKLNKYSFFDYMKPGMYSKKRQCYHLRK